MRIVSLLASATEIVCALGAGEMLVGRSHECDNPGWVRQLPAMSEPAFDVTVSSAAIDTEVRRRLRAGEPLYHVHGAAIRDLHADLVITQEHCEVCAVTPGDVIRSAGCATGAEQLSLSASSLEDVFAGIKLIAERLGLAERGRELMALERQRLLRVEQRTAGLRRPTVAMLEWTDPIFAMGNWGPELVESAHGELVLGAKGEYSRAIAAEELIRADPEYLIVAPCGYGLERAVKDLPILEAHPWWWELGAVKSGKVAFADGNLFFNRSGMTVTATAEMVAEMLHGVVSGHAAEGGKEAGAMSEGRHWRWVYAASSNRLGAFEATHA